MRKIVIAAAAGMVLGLVTAPAQAATTSAEHAACKFVRILYTDFDALEVAATENPAGRDGQASKNDLRAAAEGKGGASPLLREAARWLSRDQRFFSFLDSYDLDRGTNAAFEDLRLDRDELGAFLRDHCGTPTKPGVAKR